MDRVDHSNCEKRIKTPDSSVQNRTDRRQRGGQPGNCNAVKHGRFTQEANRRRAAIQASRRAARERLAEANALYREVRALETRFALMDTLSTMSPDCRKTLERAGLGWFVERLIGPPKKDPEEALRAFVAEWEAILAERAGTTKQGVGESLEQTGPGRLSHGPLPHPDKETRSAMAGHSQFKNIMHRKGRVDKVRSKIFSKLSREITVSAKLGMPDPDHNPRLRAAIIAAKQQSMPKDNIQRAIDKATGAGAENIEEVRYEGYGPGGVALIVETLTDNRNRTGGDVRSTFSKYGGALGEPNSVTFMFDRVGVMVYPKDKGSDDAMLEAAIDAGFDECVSDDEGHEFLVSLDGYGTARDALEAKLGQPVSAKIEWRPKTMTPVSDDNGETLIKLIDTLDDFDDVQTVFGNYELSDALLEKMEG